MKSTSTFVTSILCAGLTAVCACKKEEPAPAPQPPKTSETAPAASGTDLLNAASAAATTAGTNLANAVCNAVAQATSQAAGTDLLNAAAAPATQATTQATPQAKPADSMVQSLIDKAKSLVADQKYSDALNTLSQLTNVKLTPEQQSLVDSLKSQIQAALAKTGASDAASALGGVLGGKK